MRVEWLILTLLMVGCSFALAQSPILDQAIQVVRDWLGDPQAEVIFVHDIDTTEDLFGPRNEYVFFVKSRNYHISVDINTMRVVHWFIDPLIYIDNTNTDQPLIEDNVLKNIAINYAKQNFPHWNEFPYWEITSIFKTRFHNLDRTKYAWCYIIDLRPYFLDDDGKKIPFLATGCSVDMNPYSGDIIGFGYHYMPMTVKSLKPAFSPEEAKRRVEKAFLNMGAAQASAVWSDTGFPYEDLPDGLVLGATQTSGLRLAYAFDYVLTVGTPETEDEFGTLQMPARFRAAIDAHTGELFFYEPLPGRRLGGEKEKQLLARGLKKPFNQSNMITNTIINKILIILGILLTLLLFLWNIIKRFV